MHISCRLSTLLFLSASIWGADFQNGQAARAVIGQQSFSTHETGFTPAVLSISNTRLYVADAARHLLTFDFSQIAGAKDEPPPRGDSACAVCGFLPMATANQSVLPGVAAVSVFGRTVIMADAPNHRVLIWRDSSLPRAVRGPDIVLGHSGPETSPVSASSLIEPVSVAFDGKHLFVGDGALHRVLIWNSLPSSDGQPADAVLGQQNFASATNTDNPGPDTIDRPVALASDGTNLFVADAVLHRILVFTPGDFSLTNNALVNSASLSPGPVAPGTLVTITGNRLSEASESAPDDGERPLPHQLAGLEVFLDGVSLPLLSVSPDQIRAQIPYNLDEASSASLYIRTTHADGIVAISNAISVKLLPASPGLFAFAGTEPRTGMILRASANGEEPGRPVTSDDPARPGDVLIIWAAGLGAVDGSSANRDASAGVPYDGPDTPVLAPVIARLGGHRVQVISATLPHGAVGIYEIRVQVPRDFTPASMSSLVVSQNGQFSNTVTIPVEGIIQ